MCGIMKLWRLIDNGETVMEMMTWFLTRAAAHSSWAASEQRKVFPSHCYYSDMLCDAHNAMLKRGDFDLVDEMYPMW